MRLCFHSISTLYFHVPRIACISRIRHFNFVTFLSSTIYHQRRKSVLILGLFRIFFELISVFYWFQYCFLKVSSLLSWFAHFLPSDCCFQSLNSCRHCVVCFCSMTCISSLALEYFLRGFLVFMVKPFSVIIFVNILSTAHILLLLGPGASCNFLHFCPLLLLCMSHFRILWHP